MHNFKKMFFSVTGILLTIIIISVTIITPYMNSELAYFQDSKLRNDLSGKIDCIVLGASHALAGIDPTVLDKKLGCNSYNLSGSMMTLDGKYYLLSKEFGRNPIDTVVLEISHDTLTRNENSEFAIGDEPTVARLDSFAERIDYMLKYVSINDWLNIYSREFVMGLSFYQTLLTNGNMNNVNYEAKGYKYKDPVDITLNEQTAKKIYNSKNITASYPTTNIQKLNKIIKLCKDNNCRIVFVVVPESNALIWELNHWDAFYKWMKQYASENDCELYDINLVQKRNTIFTDDVSFSDLDHLSASGAQITTELLAQAMLNPDHWEKQSYNSYDEMKKDSQYAYCIKQ